MASGGAVNGIRPSTAAVALDSSSPPMFSVERVQLQFTVAADFVAAQVANNVLVLALSNGRILRIDLNKPEDIDDIDLPKSVAEVGVIRRLFLDPTASHLIICTTLGEVYYLPSQSRAPRTINRLRGIPIQCVAWNPSLPTSSTREVLLGATDGTVHEAFFDTTARGWLKHLRPVYKIPDGSPVTGLWAGLLPSHKLSRQLLIASPTCLLHIAGRIALIGSGGGIAYSTLFKEYGPPAVHEGARSPPSVAAPSALVVTPDRPQDRAYEGPGTERAFAWLSSQGVFHGRLLLTVAPAPDGLIGRKIFAESKTLPRIQTTTSTTAEHADAIALTQWHVVQLIAGRVVVSNRLSGVVVYEQTVFEPDHKALGFSVDLQKNTIWLFTSDEIFEIVVRDEDRNIWQTLAQSHQFEAALRFAHTQDQREIIATARGNRFVSAERWAEAATAYVRSNKPFEDVALLLMNKGQYDALRRYLLIKLGATEKSAVTQRILMGSWLVELFMARLNGLDDTIANQSEATVGRDSPEPAQPRHLLRQIMSDTEKKEPPSRGLLGPMLAAAEATDADTIPQPPSAPRELLPFIGQEYRDFVKRHGHDLDRKTAYDIISSHGREDELIYLATVVEDFDYIISHWLRREKWSKALEALQRQSNPELFYRYSIVLMLHLPRALVDVWMRQPSLQPARLMPALLEYNERLLAVAGPLVPATKNHAMRYLWFAVFQAQSRDAAVHNTLVSIYASHPARGETGLLTYLESQAGPPCYDADFALRLCIRHHRTLCCVHIYSAMGQYAQAVDLALAHDEIGLAAVVADRPGKGDPRLRKKLWLSVARRVISQPPQDLVKEVDEEEQESSDRQIEKGDGKKGEQDREGSRRTGGGGGGVRAAVEFLKRCELLRIEDLIPFFPDFVVIDEFREEICKALENYGRSIEALRREIDDAARTAGNIRLDIADLDQRYVVVQPGERCYVCELPLLSRQFFVFACQHAFHSDCLARRVLEQVGPGQGSRIRQLQAKIGKGLVTGDMRDALVDELDALVASECILCSDFAIKRIDEPFIHPDDDLDEWAV